LVIRRRIVAEKELEGLEGQEGREEQDGRDVAQGDAEQKASADAIAQGADVPQASDVAQEPADPQLSNHAQAPDVARASDVAQASDDAEPVQLPDADDSGAVTTADAAPGQDTSHADDEAAALEESDESSAATAVDTTSSEPASVAVAIDEDDEEEFKRPAAELKAIVEALIFASPDPLTPKALLKLLDNEPKEDVLAALDALRQDYDRPGGLQLVEVAGGFQIVTRPDLHEWVRRLFHERSTQKLSVAALETLAVIAYRQPITAIEITEIRGVNTSGVLNTLLERHLVKIVGRKQVVGRPFMYATTKEFLIRFGLKDLNDLPKVEDMAESLGIESSLLVERTPPEEQLPLSEPDTPILDDDAAGAADEPASDDDDEPGPSVH
jgi:segregation and condensation protein B